jgi:hypothetical protein
MLHAYALCQFCLAAAMHRDCLQNLDVGFSWHLPYMTKAISLHLFSKKDHLVCAHAQLSSLLSLTMRAAGDEQQLRMS